tara:strand:+ start:260 stop:475 length:216 start_codon:yes stop_codon:yes gene_type:complete
MGFLVLALLAVFCLFIEYLLTHFEIVKKEFNGQLAVLLWFAIMVSLVIWYELVGEVGFWIAMENIREFFSF